MLMRLVLIVIFFLTAGVVSAGEPAAAGSGVLTELQERMDNERRKEAELQMLQLEVERLKLELERKKTMAELGKVDGAVHPHAAVSMDGVGARVRLVNLFLSAGRREAVLACDGVEQRVKEGEKAGGGHIKAISADGVIFQDRDGNEILLKPDR